MNYSFSSKVSKEQVFLQIHTELEAQDFKIINEQFRPWGGFFVLDETQAQVFIEKYFSSVETIEVETRNKLSPKILIVEAGKRLSWQYHHRRSEIWIVIGGDVGVIKSDSDIEGKTELFKIGDVIKLRQGERHRLVGLNAWGIVAEIWQHTDNQHISDEDDIVRISDDFGR